MHETFLIRLQLIQKEKLEGRKIIDLLNQEEHFSPLSFFSFFFFANSSVKKMACDHIEGENSERRG